MVQGKHLRRAAIQMTGFAAICLALATCLHAAQFRLLTIGDSLTEEYRFEIPFSAPNSNPTEANVKNWVELLIANRGAAFSMGGYEASAGNYADYRNAGYEYNYGVPGFKAERWDEVLYRQYSFSDLLNPENALAASTRFELKGDLSSVNAVLIFVGGNDLSLANGDAKNDEIRVFIGRIHDYVRANAPVDLPIIIATVPDIGATPAEKLPIPATAAIARHRVSTLNANIAALGSRANTYVARIDAITDRVFDQIPFHINGTHFTYFDSVTGRENPPLHLFCKDGFHPGMAAQALIANEILKAINQFAPTPIPLFTNREILSTILGQNPDQPYLDYVGGSGGMLENPDGDTLPNLVEYLLATSPAQSNPAFSFLPGGAATFTPSPTAQRFADLTVLQSATLLDDWVPVPEASLQSFPDGSMKILPTATKIFYKFKATPKP